MKAILSGNEAIARGAFESGVRVATAYPGTPSTEILENINRYETIDCGWSPNEKVALEVGFGAAMGGARTLVAMKHVGVNVAADPLMTLSYTGINGGLVLISADDPGMHSSQNEQDNRLYAQFAKIPMLEPSDSQECKDFVAAALDISEAFDTPVILRTTTRISHSRTVVQLGEEKPTAVKDYIKSKEKYVMLPGYARLRHPLVEKRLAQLKAYAETTPLNRIEWGNKAIGVVTSGVTYQYVKEALPEASILKLGFSYPLPEKLIRQFAAEVGELFVVEELEPFFENQIKAMGLAVKGKELFSPLGELGPGLIAEKIGAVKPVSTDETKKPEPSGSTEDPLPARPPILCPGCSHRALFFTLKRLKLAVTGDIGCYTLGALPPLDSMDSCLCMGASIGAALGMEKAHPDAWKTTVAVIGDSTFFHSGITPLMDVVYNRGKTTVVIADNRTTAMTGHQEHPGTGKTLRGAETHAVDMEDLVRSLGVKRVITVNPLELDRLKEIVQAELDAPEPSVVIARCPCALAQKKEKPFGVNEENCTGCKACLRPGCPAMSLQENEEAATVFIDPNLCNGCGLCFQLCRYEAITR